MVRILLGSRLAGLAADLLAYVANTLPLVRLRRAHRSELGRHLSHQLLVCPFDLDHGVVVHRDLDALGSLVLDRMGVAHDQVHPIRLCLGLVPDTLDLEALGEAFGDPLDHVLYQRPGQAVQRLVPFFLAGTGDGELVVAEGNLHFRVQRAAELAPRPLYRHRVPLHLKRDALGNRHRFSSYTRHVPSYQTTASNSPPRLALRASRSVIRPRGVETIAMPRPFLTRGSSRHFT